MGSWSSNTVQLRMVILDGRACVMYIVNDGSKSVLQSSVQERW